MKADKLIVIKKTQEIERVRAITILNDLTKMWKHNAMPEEYSHILEFEKSFKEKIQND